MTLPSIFVNPMTTLNDIIVGLAGGVATRLGIGANTFPARSSTGDVAAKPITDAALTVLDDATVAAMVDTLGGAASTGTGGIARATSPTFVTPLLGTPTSGVLTNCTGLPTAGLVDDAVTYAKIQNVSATDKVLGRTTAGAGDVEEITCTATGRSILDDASVTAVRTTIGLDDSFTVCATTATALTIGGGDTASETRWLEPSGGGTSYVGFKSPALAANTVYDLPNAFPAVNGYVLSCTTAGVMSWVVQSGGANTALSNLASVAINTTLVSDTDNTDDLGTSSISWRTLYIGTSIELGHATDTTLTRSSAGVAAVEGNVLYMATGTDVVAADGGTGRSSHTAYAVICGGTTTTAAQQSIASVGTFGQTLRSAGAGALPVFAGGMTLLATATASASATVDFTLTEWTNSVFAAYKIVFSNVSPATDAVAFWIRTSSDGGSTYDAGASDYRWVTNSARSDLVIAATADDADAQIALSGALSNVANEYMNGEVLLFDPSAAVHTYILSHLSYVRSDALLSRVMNTGGRLSAADVDAIRFLMSSGNIASGEFRLYGLSNA